MSGHLKKQIGFLKSPYNFSLPIIASRYLLFFAALLFSFSCSEEELNEQKAFLSTEKILDFGEVQIGRQKTLPLPMIVKGIGSVTIIKVKTPPEKIILKNIVSQVSKESSTKFYISYRPLEEEVLEESLEITYRNPQDHSVTVKLIGKSIPGEKGGLKVEPEPLDFGLVPKNSSHTKTLKISNQGPGDLKILKFALKDGKDFEILSSTKTPFFMAKGSFSQIPIRLKGSEADKIEDELLIESNDKNSALKKVKISAQTNNGPKMLISPEKIYVKPGSTISLDGSKSFDPEKNDPLKYFFKLYYKPKNSRAELKFDPTSSKADLKTDLMGRYLVTLTGEDSKDIPSQNMAIAEILALPKDQVIVQLLYDHKEADLDLHLIRGEDWDKFFSEDDCFFGNDSPEWGDPAEVKDNPKLDGDNRLGLGTENIYISEPKENDFLVGVHYFSANATEELEEVKAKIRFFIQGKLMAEYSKVIKSESTLWKVAKIDFKQRKIEKIDKEEIISKTGP